jgi:hypothetical protein
MRWFMCMIWMDKSAGLDAVALLPIEVLWIALVANWPPFYCPPWTDCCESYMW